MAQTQNYQQLSGQLEELLASLQQPNVDVDEALKLYGQAQLIIEKLETYLKIAENKIKNIKLNTV